MHEIERKYLVDLNLWKPTEQAFKIVQGYLSIDPERTVRIRLVDDREAFITIKGKSIGISRLEFEYEIPIKDGIELVGLCVRPLIEKTRYIENFRGHLWSVDVFSGENAGLVLAEIELTDETEEYPLPKWAIQDVSHDPSYFNSNLMLKPYSKLNI
jgi:adenylate cyclase